LSNLLSEVQGQLWDPAGIDLGQVEGLMGRLMSPSVDIGELFFQRHKSQSWSLEDGIVKDGSFSVDQGVGVRAVSGEKTGFAYAEDIVMPALESATEAARSIARHGQERQIQAWREPPFTARYGKDDPIASLPDAEKVALLLRVDALARQQDPRVSEVNVRLSASHESMLVMASDGTLCADVRPLVRLDVSVIVTQHGRRERGSAGGGGRNELSLVADAEFAADLAREAVRTALVNLEASDAPAGAMTVVLGPGWPGVLLHEAVGHGLEGDFNRKGSSAFSGRVGEKVASELCTVVDNGTMPGRRGSLSVDDEGCPTQETVLIEDGVLRGYMQDKLNARLMNVASTGNGRRQSFAHLPMPRMTNTFMRPGPHDPEEIVASVKRGIYAVNFGGGQVDITSGRFVFSATEAYLIEDGKVTAPIRGATLIGNGPEVMTRISVILQI
jgi:TldD protein